MAVGVDPGCRISTCDQRQLHLRARCPDGKMTWQGDDCEESCFSRSTFSLLLVVSSTVRAK